MRQSRRANSSRKKGQKNRKRKGQGQEEKEQRERQPEPTSGVLRLTKASEKWYITTKNKQGKFVHVVSVYKKNSPNYAAIALNIFCELQSHPNTTQEEAIAMRDGQMQ